MVPFFPRLQNKEGFQTKLGGNLERGARRMDPYVRSVFPLFLDFLDPRSSANHGLARLRVISFSNGDDTSGMRLCTTDRVFAKET